MQKFNKKISNLLYEIGSEKDRGGDGIGAVDAYISSLFFGNSEARKKINNKGNEVNINELKDYYYGNDFCFQIFIINRLGIGGEVNIKKSNLYLKNAVDNKEIGALLYKSLVEQVRKNEEGALEHLSLVDDSMLLKERCEEIKYSKEQKYDGSVKELLAYDKEHS